MALLDTVKQQLGNPQSQAPAHQGGNTQTVRDLLRAKSGKASQPGAGPQQSSLQEQTAEAQAKAGMQQLGLRGRLQGQQLEQQQAQLEQQGQQQEAQFQDTWQNVQANMNRQANQLLQQFEMGQKSLQSQRDLASLEQLGFQARLQNDQYIQQLQDVGKRNRLDNQLEFKKQLAQNVFQDQQDLLQNKLAFDHMMAADDRTFMEELANMDINYAMQVADNTAKAAATQQMFQGAGTAVSGGMQAAGMMGIFNSTSNTSPGASGEATVTGTPAGLSGTNLAEA